MRPNSLDHWQVMFEGIFSEKNLRDYTASDALLHVQEEAAKIDEGLRKDNKEEILRALPFLFCWLLAFCNMTGMKAEQAIWMKYQEACPYCGKKQHCMCISAETKPSSWIKNPQGKMPGTIKDWQNMFHKIYGRINKMSWTIQIWLHFHEELGELSKEFRLNNETKMKEEFADCFAWLMALCNKLGVDLSEITWEVYPGVCSHCKKEKCECCKV
jgi:NTP pyrophosphatase (non-canonical NTP hydrolase)